MGTSAEHYGTIFFGHLCAAHEVRRARHCYGYTQLRASLFFEQLRNLPLSDDRRDGDFSYGISHVVFAVFWLYTADHDVLHVGVAVATNELPSFQISNTCNHRFIYNL